MGLNGRLRMSDGRPTNQLVHSAQQAKNESAMSHMVNNTVPSFVSTSTITSMSSAIATEIMQKPVMVSAGIRMPEFRTSTPK